MKRIIVGYDESEESKRALERATELVQAFAAKLFVVSVAPLLEPASGRGAGGIDATDSPQDHLAELARAREHLQAEGIEAEYQAAVGEPSVAIVELANEREADLIVVGTHAHGRI